MKRRLPLQPLLDRHDGPWREFRTRVGSRDSVLRRAEVEGLDPEQADKYACRLGFHPLEVWGPAWEEALCSS